MPYIKSNLRPGLFPTSDNVPSNPGELNFMVTRLINDYMLSQPFNYQVINDIIGALEGAKMEFYRRVVIPYEDRKIIENGDVYD